MINWGIIGCGDVTEVKSGPAFNKVPGSKLVAVMRRNAAKAADYAKRHNVPRWYSDAEALINDAEVNAIYIATPPSSHEAYALAAIKAGKPVYVEKPMTLNYAAAVNMADAANTANVKLTVAHYRRQWPLFQKVKALLAEKAIGEVRLVQLNFFKQAPTAAELSDEKYMWRFDLAIAGGGLFHDLAPHQLDILYYLFGGAASVNGLAVNQGGYYAVPDLVNGQVLFKNGIVFTGSWCFTAAEACDECVIIGNNGSIRFSFFNDNSITLHRNNETIRFDFERLQHVQQPMIAEVVNYFSGNASNPCTAEEGAEIMRWMDEMVK
ncbi:Gfo/Idh/MocA family oxidoreductase [Lacibacter luteus]|uniref:Gfo/Idh/MocA family oxidoreductase n=1 Tax=Lacibacter luteus TaxID=2508719 RepID=A0A4Q1CFV7_9BACT|nr:Gfo/Idh/MocA family oxidoreductase [Lacibacter luteus]RXK58859.1 Gfo/Idh/MocA family oxidoreductase [Lacibacter luteus]